MSLPIEVALNEKGHDDAFTEVGFLLQMLASTVEDVIGNPAPLGVSAGRAMANKLPVRLVEPTLEKALEVLAEALSGAITFAPTFTESGAVLEVSDCAIRDICRMQDEEIGARVCKLFHHYLSGMGSQLLGKQTRITSKAVGERCTLELTRR
jgi:hypothetical protein